MARFPPPPPTAMDRAYWEAVAGDYEGEVLSVFDYDCEGQVRSRIAAAGARRPEGTAADLGCGVGKFTPLLAEVFALVEACDLAARGIAETRRRCAGMEGVSVHQLDLATEVPPFAPVDFALCVNVLLMPSLDERRRAWRTVTSQVARGGSLLLVVPALESIQMERFRDLEAQLDEGASTDSALAESLPSETTAVELQQGVHRLGGLPTKHYFREELRAMLAEHEMVVEELIALRYRAAPGGPLLEPWDWLALARRK